MGNILHDWGNNLDENWMILLKLLDVGRENGEISDNTSYFPIFVVSWGGDGPPMWTLTSTRCSVTVYRSLAETSRWHNQETASKSRV